MKDVQRALPTRRVGPSLPLLVVRRAVFEAKTVVAKYPGVALPIARRRHGIPVGDDTELVIEAFPRSGMTFAVVAFEMAQTRRVRVASTRLRVSTEEGQVRRAYRLSPQAATRIPVAISTEALTKEGLSQRARVRGFHHWIVLQCYWTNTAPEDGRPWPIGHTSPWTGCTDVETRTDWPIRPQRAARA